MEQARRSPMVGRKVSASRPSARSVSKQEWEKKMSNVRLKKEDMNALIMNFLVTEGYVDAAKSFQQESGTPPGVDLDAITDRMHIRKAVQGGDIEEAVDLVNDFNPEILELQPQLSFHLQQQRLIELVRQGKVEEALDFAQEYLAPQGEGNPAFLQELERTVALLAFENAASSPVADLMDAAQRQKTASEVNAAILKSQHQISAEAELPHQHSKAWGSSAGSQWVLEGNSANRLPEHEPLSSLGSGGSLSMHQAAAVHDAGEWPFTEACTEAFTEAASLPNLHCGSPGVQFDIRAQPSCRVNGTVPLITILKHSSFPSGAKARPRAGSREEAGLVCESIDAAHPAADLAAQAAPDNEAQTQSTVVGSVPSISGLQTVMSADLANEPLPLGHPAAPAGLVRFNSLQMGRTFPGSRKAVRRMVSQSAAEHQDSDLAATEVGRDCFLNMPMTVTPRTRGPHCFLSERQASVELFYRLNHARQTVDFVKRQAAAFSQLDKGRWTIWEALDRLSTLREYEAALLAEPGSDIPLLEHAFQTAEACRAAFPESDWLHLCGLIHGLGKVLAHASHGMQPQWAVCGESFPVGCKFSPHVAFSRFFSVNPDRRRRLLNTDVGMYSEQCGLNAVLMSWSAAEYLYMLLVLNRVKLPPEALFVLRHQKFNALTDSRGAYWQLLSDRDVRMLPWLEAFQELAAYRRQPVPGALEGQALRKYYSALIDKYIPGGLMAF